VPPAYLEPREGLTVMAEDADYEKPAVASQTHETGTPENPA
jgi:hypothetical protein